jgi:hypothetical protein
MSMLAWRVESNNWHAERGIAFMSQFNKTLTKNEDENQKIIQVVENNRKQIPNPKKKTLINFQSL